MRWVWLWMIVAGAALASGRAATAQQLDGPNAGRGPRFLLVSQTASAPVPLDVARTAVLRRRISLDLHDVTLQDALKIISARAGLDLVYGSDVVPLMSRVDLRADGIAVAAALTDVLLDAGVDVVFSPDGRATLVKRPSGAVLEQAGTIVGTVTDAKTGEGVVGVNVTIDGTRFGAITGDSGAYRIGGVAPGRYTVTAKRLGYERGSQQVTVIEDQNVVANFALTVATSMLDQVVVTGTVVPTEVKALPMPISVISDSDIARQHPRSLQQVLRQAVPGAVSFDYAPYPYYSTASVRGASTLAGGAQMKIFIDGIEAAVPTISPVDPNSIERIEVIRGPQAAAIYGPDAIGGVIQIFTKHGDASLTRPQVSAEASLGMVQTPYAGYGAVGHQNYQASLRGGGPGAGYTLGAGYSHTGNYIPHGELSAQSIPSVYGGLRFTHDAITVGISGRYHIDNSNIVFNPELFESGYAPYSKPYDRPQQFQNLTVGARINWVATSWWQHTLTMGVDRYFQDAVGDQPRETTPADTLLSVYNLAEAKASISYTTSVEGHIGAGTAASVTGGFDHYSLPLINYSTNGALNTAGTLRLAPGQSISGSRTVTTNTGYFVQGQLGFRDVLFLTVGLRADQNSNFGKSLSTPISPRVGLSYVQELGVTTLKLRSSYGRAIRAPLSWQQAGVEDPVNPILANPQLGPERQHGWDVGIDAAFGARGSLGVSYYNQLADNLIDLVTMGTTSELTRQYQNVGRVRNTGMEVEGTFNAGPLQLKGQYAYTRARVLALSPTYTGSVRVGDQTLATPKHTAGASVTAVPRHGTTLTAGLTYVGSWNQTDWLTEFRCFGKTGPCRPTARDYVMPYPSLLKVNAAVSQQLGPVLSGFISVDNLTNNQHYEFYNFYPVRGRTTMVGLRFHY